MAQGESDPAQLSPSSSRDAAATPDASDALSDELLLRLLGRDTLASKGLTRLEFNSQLLGYATQHLILWGLAGYESSLQAYQRLVELFPSGSYRVRYTREQLGTLAEELADVRYQLERTKTEALAGLGRAEAAALSGPDHPASASCPDAAGAQLGAFRQVVAQLEERLRRWSAEAPRLPLSKALPGA